MKRRLVKSLVLFILILNSINYANAAQHQNGSAYIWWFNTFLGPSSAITQTIEIKELSPRIYWSSAWHWKNAPDGGYGGLQTLGHLGNNVWTDIATFSIWNADQGIPGDGANCLSFGGEGEGYSCRLPIKLIKGNSYTFEYSLDDKRGSDWWKASVTDNQSGIKMIIGTIKAPMSNLQSQDWYNFTEYWGEPVSCDAVGKATAKYSTPKSSDPLASPSSFGPSFGYFMMATDACVNAAVDSPARGFPGDVLLRFGGPYQPLSTIFEASNKDNSKTEKSRNLIPKKIIYCTKGKVTKRILGKNPTCPTGYSKK